MVATQLEIQPRTGLKPGATAQGEIAVGPNFFWRVPLDKASLRWKNDLIQLTAHETGIESSALTVIGCIQGFWDAFEQMVKGFRTGTLEPTWIPPEHRLDYKNVLTARHLETIATPPTDGEPYTLRGEFWDEACPRERNPRPKPLSYPPW